MKTRSGGGRKALSHLGRLNKILTGSEASALRKLKKNGKAERDEGILRKRAKKEDSEEGGSPSASVRTDNYLEPNTNGNGEKK